MLEFSSADEVRAVSSQLINPQSCSTNQFSMIVRGACNHSAERAAIRT
jgi:hypothetical protein